MNDISYLIQMGKLNLFHRKHKFPKDLIEVLKLSTTTFCKHTIKENKHHRKNRSFMCCVFPKHYYSVDLFFSFHNALSIYFFVCNIRLKIDIISNNSI